ncbi:MAG: M20 family metallo-hydrolase [Schwartzia sp.]|nr:M20 family metallo-hydrolase [Schwartzia sp. (in: firmicutes)]
MIDRARLEAQFAHMRGISAPGEGGPGIYRLAFTDADWQGRTYLMRLMQEAGLALREDAFGNVIGRMEGTDPALPVVLFGSHADSVPGGGNFDGVLGILAAIETARSLNEDGFRPEHPLEVVLFLCEESSRFGAATLGSRAMLGELTVEEAHRYRDKDGISLYKAMTARGLEPEALGKPLHPGPVKAFFEVHIEQGKVLEHEGKEIGLVTGIAAPTRFRVRLTGSADHSGATPMALRHDAACAAAEIVLAAEVLAQAENDPPAVATVGMLQIEPGVMNVIPGTATLGVDIRSIDDDVKARVAKRLQRRVREIGERRGVAVDIEPISDERPVAISPKVLDFLEEIARESGCSYRRMPSGAGHDAMHWAERVPAGMLFIPCKDGLSHNPNESAKMEDILTVTRLLEKAVRRASRKDTRLE